MNILKLLLVYFFIPLILFSQDLGDNVEIGLQNHSGDELEMQLYPISGIFNGNNKYTLISANPSLEPPGSTNDFLYNYLNGTCYRMDEYGNRVLSNKYSIPSNTPYAYFGWNYDWGATVTHFGTIIYGNYKLIIKNIRTERIDSCFINFDYFVQSGVPGDLYFFLFPDGSEHRFYYKFDKQGNTNVIVDVDYGSPDGYTAKSWQPNGPNNLTNSRSKNFGNFELVDLPPDYNDNFPLDSRKDCNLYYPLLDFHFGQNQVYPDAGFDERHGIIPLNLTIKKKVVTPIYQTTGYPANLLISIEPSVVFTIDKCPAPNPTHSGFTLNPYQNTANGNDLVLKSSISLDPDSLTNLTLTSGTNYNENSRIRVRNNCKIIAENRSKIVLGDYSQIILDRLENQTTQINSKLLLQNNSNIVFGANSEINVNAYGEFVNEGGLISYNQNSNAEINIQSNGLYEIKSNVTNTHTVNNGGRIILQGGQLKIGDNSSLVFDGSTSYMQVDAGSSISLGQNAKIEFKNGAYMIANGGTISSLNASTPGKGLVFENSSAQTSISNMTFNNLTNAIYIYNTTVGYSGVLKNISNNIFNGNEFCNYVIEAKNANNLTIAYNQIYMQPSKGIGVLLRYPTELGDGMSASVPYTVNIYNNTIANGNISAAFVCLTNSYAGVNFKYNNCYGSVSHGNINMRQIIGDIKYNTLNSVSGKSLEINQSVPNVLSNTISSSNISVYNYDSYPKFAPVPDEIGDGGWIWVGGKNTITSTNNDNLYFSGGNVLLDWGLNCFYKGVNNFHLHGNIDAPNLSYLVRNNGFNGSNSPVSQLFDISSGLVVNPYSVGSNFSCSNSTDAGTIWQINDLGNGVYDTLYKTSNTSGYQAPQDEVLYSTATQKMILDQNFDAVSYFKSLITGFPGSSYSEACLYSLYKCYQALDTSSNQGVRDILYTDLKNYLDGKILTGLYSDEFNYTAYNITMMCLASIADYNDAMSGYEFIALYHPDAYTRLLASWDYAEVQELLNGSGGTSSKEENLTDAEYFAKLAKRVSKGINEDPIKKKVKKSFDKVKTEKTSKVEKDAIAKSNDEKSAKLEVAKMKQKDEMMNTKVTSVMRYSKTLKKEEREKMQVEDILFSNKSESKDEIKVNANVPVVYTLSQNYPNPFNPVTKINFALPKQGFVSLKIYDITGREIQTLVNEVKQAGYYSFDFNGSSLASGVYFYRIQSGDFVMTKRMVLVK